MRSIFFFTLLLPAVLALPAVDIRESFVTIPITARINATNIRNVFEADRARARLLVQMAQEKISQQQSVFSTDAVIGTMPVTHSGINYLASVGIGTPPTQYHLKVDTGSSNTWVGAGKKFVETPSTKFTGQKVAVNYGTVNGNSGSFSGLEFTDMVTLAPNLVIKKQSCGNAQESEGFTGIDGVLGIGPTDLTIGTLTPNKDDKIPTVHDSLFAQGTLSANKFAISFEPITADPITNGQITFGGTDPSKFTGTITYTPITSKAPANKFWGIDQSVKYGDTEILELTYGVVDTGTILIKIASHAFEQYFKHTGGVIDETNGLIRLTTAQFDKLHNLNFIIAGRTFALTPNGQAWPRSLNHLIGGNAHDVYLIVSDIGANAPFDFINGQTFMQRFYTVYDTANEQVGFATTPFTNAITD